MFGLLNMTFAILHSGLGMNYFLLLILIFKNAEILINMSTTLQTFDKISQSTFFF